MPQETNQLFEFGPFQADLVRRTLSRDGEPVPLTSKGFDTLQVLLQNRDRVMEKDELLKAIWPNSFVEEANLAQNVSSLRKALGDQPGANRYIATVPGRGYRFVAAVKLPYEPSTEVVVEQRTTAEVVIEEERVTRTRPSKRMVAAGVAVAILLGAGYFWQRRQTAEPSRLQSLAVLPFQQLTPSPGEEYLGVGLSDAVITRLSNIRQLVVRPTSAVLKYISPAADARIPGRELGVEAVLDGKVQKAGDRIRVTVQLIRVSDGRPLWAETFDEQAAGIFAVEDSVSLKVAEALAIHVAGAEKKQLTRHYTENVEAYRSYLQGRYAAFRFTRQGLNQAIEFFNRAIALDSSYALAYAGLADAYTVASDWQLSPRQALPKAEAAARKALEFDDNLAEAHGSLAHALLHEWKLPAADAEFQRALALNPNNTAFYFSYSEYLSALGKEDEAVRQLQKALQVNPLSGEILSFMGWPLYLKGDFQAAMEAGHKSIAADPDFWLPHMGEGMSLIAMGRYGEAIAKLEKARSLNPDSTLLQGEIGEAYGRWGKRAEAMQILEGLRKLSETQYVSPMDIAVIYVALGEKDKAFEYLDKAYDDQSEMLIFLKLYPPFHDLRSDPRFDQLLRRVGVS